MTQEETQEPSAVDLVLTTAIRFGGMFSTQPLFNSTAMVMLGQSDGQKQGSMATLATKNCSQGIAEAIENQHLLSLPVNTSIFDQQTKQFKATESKIFLVSFSGYQKVTPSDKQQELGKDSMQKALSLIKAVPDQFTLRVGVGWVDIANIEFSRADLGRALSYCLYAGWIQTGLNCEILVTSNGKAQRNQ